MKNKLLFIGIFIVAFTANAQFTVEDHHGTPILDGDIVSVDQVGTAGELPFYVYNTSSSDINMKIEFMSLQNGAESQIELCFGLCYTGLTLGESYPGNTTGITIAPGQHQDSSGDHILNTDLGNGTEVLDYVFKFYQVDNTGQPTGTPLTMTYRYDPTLGVEEMNKLEVSVYPTVVNDMLTIETDEVLDMEVYNLQGRLVKSTALSIGQNEIGMSNLVPQMYLVRFENELGQSQTSKVIVQ